MHDIDALRKRFADVACLRPFDPLPIIRDRGLVLGHGTLLARMTCNRRGETMLALDCDEERLLTLLSAVCGGQISPRILHYVGRASEQWRRGDKVLANIELAFARIPRLATKEDAFRLFLAENLLAQGFTPRRLMRELGFDPRLLKYDEHEPRDWHGRWARIFGDGPAPDWMRIFGDEPAPESISAQARTSAAIAARVPSVIESASPAIAEWLAAYALGATFVTTLFGLLVIPTPNDGGVHEGDVPGLEKVRYRYSIPTGELEFTATANDGEELTLHTKRRGKIYFDENGRALGKDVGTGVYADLDAVKAAFVARLIGESGDDQRPVVRLGDEPAGDTVNFPRSDEPKLCPASSPARGKKKGEVPTDNKLERDFDELYQEYIGSIVNPTVRPPVSAKLAFYLFNPVSGRMVEYDHCRLSDGHMIEAKGHYERILKFWMAAKYIRKEWLDQANRQIEAAKANGERPVEWYFYEESSMKFAEELFTEKGIADKIELHRKDYPGTKEWPYPTKEQRTWAKGRQKK